MSIVLGLTGVTGSGKSTAAEYFRSVGAAVVDADKLAREAVLDKGIIEKLAKTFGNDILDENGAVVRKKLAVKAFSSTSSAKLLSSITHPYILKKSEEIINGYKSRDIGIIIFDAPLLYQSGSDAMCDKVLFIDAPGQSRITRIMKRDGIDREAAEMRTAVQSDMERFRSLADYVIFNDGDIAKFTEKCSEICDLLKK